MWGTGEAAGLLWRTVAGAALLFLPVFAVCAVAIRRGLRDFRHLELLALCAAGCSGYLSFWLWFSWAPLGQGVGFALPVASAVCVVWIVRRTDSGGRALLRRLLNDVVLITAIALLVVSYGFLYGGMRWPIDMAQARFGVRLPSDNWLPWLLAQAVVGGHVPQPLTPDGWHSSDRPPLETGMFLSVFSYLKSQECYIIIGAVAQSFWILSLRVFLDSLGVARKVIAWMLVVCMFSGFVFLNTFFVWPKLLAASYMIAALAVMFRDQRSGVRAQGAEGGSRKQEARSQLLVGVLIGFGMLAHGGSAFAVLGMAAYAVFAGLRLPHKSLARIVLAAVLVYLPWVLYQRFYDPPGDHLLKEHLAGVAVVDPRPFLQVLVDAYNRIGWHQAAANKFTNLRVVLGLGYFREYWHWVLSLVDFRSAGRIYVAAGHLRDLSFFFFGLNLGFLMAGPVALLAGMKRRCRSDEWRAACRIWLYIGCTVAFWCLLMFSPGSTVIHQGTYVIVLLGHAGAILALWAVRPMLAVVLGTMQIVLNFVLYVVTVRPGLVDVYLPNEPMRYCMLLLCVGASIGVVSLLKRAANERE